MIGVAGRTGAAAVERDVVDDLCDLLDAVASPIGRFEVEIKARAKPDPSVEALQGCPASVS